MSISEFGQEDLRWWLTPSAFEHKKLSLPPVILKLQTDASLSGWGCFNTSTGESAGGRWSICESNNHINWLELKACFLSLQCFAKNCLNGSIHIEMDNTVALSYIKNFGGKILSLDILAKETWHWAGARNLHLYVSHIPGVENTQADHKSRIFHDPTEWSLADPLFQKIILTYGPPSIDLFGSRLNFKCAVYCSWQPDPNCHAVDALSIDWSKFSLGYAFPPFNMIGKVNKKMLEDRAELILVAPYWPTQPWFTQLYEYRVKGVKILHFNCRKCNLTLPYDQNAVHPLWKKLRLSCFRLSGKL
jgi:hypothetical protein